MENSRNSARLVEIMLKLAQLLNARDWHKIFAESVRSLEA